MATKRFMQQIAWIAFVAIFGLLFLRHFIWNHLSNYSSELLVSSSPKNKILDESFAPFMGSSQSDGLKPQAPNLPVEPFEEPFGKCAEHLKQMEPYQHPALFSSEKLLRFLPEWMDCKGVDVHSERISVASRIVTRVRGRYEWPNGSFMEIELTDVGGNLDKLLLKSLGFNVEIPPSGSFQESTPSSGIPLGLLSQEYDKSSTEGFVQLCVADRFLVEVKLCNLPYDSFKTILELQLAEGGGWVSQLELMANENRTSEFDLKK